MSDWIRKALLAGLMLALVPMSVQATTLFRSPLDQMYLIRAWKDDGTLYNANRRYDGFIFYPGSPFYYGTSPRHRGTDFSVPQGTPVRAAAKGVVEYVFTGCVIGDRTCGGGGFGNFVVIQHSDGMRSIYAHLSVVYVTGGTQISCGTQIGLSGNTGNSTGPHLHIEFRSGGWGPGNQSIDPFGGAYSTQWFDYWYQWVWVYDPAYNDYLHIMKYPTTTCQP